MSVYSVVKTQTVLTDAYRFKWLYSKMRLAVYYPLFAEDAMEFPVQAPLALLEMGPQGPPNPGPLSM